MTLLLVLSLPGPIPSMIQPATLQPSQSMRLLTAGDASGPVAPAAPDDAPARAAAPCAMPGQVLRAERHFERTIEELWHRSPTFRRQVARLTAGSLLVTIEPCWTHCPSTVRAQTTVEYQHGVPARATVQIQGRPSETAELIAHELEHVIEQLDGVDLARLASRGNPVVQLDQNGHYETGRAQYIGRIAAVEYRTGAEMAFTCERTTP
jgi:hypothetical protein